MNATHFDLDKLPADVAQEEMRLLSEAREAREQAEAAQERSRAAYKRLEKKRQSLRPELAAAESGLADRLIADEAPQVEAWATLRDLQAAVDVAMLHLQRRWPVLDWQIKQSRATEAFAAANLHRAIADYRQQRFQAALNREADAIGPAAITVSESRWQWGLDQAAECDREGSRLFAEASALEAKL